MRFDPFLLTADAQGAGSVALNPGYSVQAVVVDNLTTGWVQLSRSDGALVANPYVAPGQVGKVIWLAQPLTSGLTLAFSSPPGLVSTPQAGAGSQVWATTYDSVAPPQPTGGSISQVTAIDATITNSQLSIAGPVTIDGGQGGSIQVLVATPPRNVGMLTVPAGAGTAIFSYVADANDQSALIIFYLKPLGANGLKVISVTATGVSGEVYLNQTGTDLQGPFGFPVPGNSDNGNVGINVVVTLNTNAVNAINIGQLTAFATNYVTEVINQQDSPLFVQGATSGMLPVLGQSGRLGASLETVPYPPQTSLKVGYIAAAGGTAGIIAGAAGQAIRLWEVDLDQDVSAFSEIDLQSPGGTTFAGGGVSASLHWHRSFRGLALPLGQNLVIYTSAAGTVLGTITYDQY